MKNLTPAPALGKRLGRWDTWEEFDPKFASQNSLLILSVLTGKFWVKFFPSVSQASPKCRGHQSPLHRHESPSSPAHPPQRTCFLKICLVIRWERGRPVTTRSSRTIAIDRHWRHRGVLARPIWSEWTVHMFCSRLCSRPGLTITRSVRERPRVQLTKSASGELGVLELQVRAFLEVARARLFPPRVSACAYMALDGTIKLETDAKRSSHRESCTAKTGKAWPELEWARSPG